MQGPKQLPRERANGEPGLDEVRWQVAMSNYFYRKLRGLELDYVPDLPDKITEAYYRQIQAQSRTSKPPSVWDLFKAPFWLEIQHD